MNSILPNPCQATGQKRLVRDSAPTKRALIYLRYDSDDKPTSEILSDRIACQNCAEALEWRHLSTIIEFGSPSTRRRPTICMSGILESSEQDRFDILLVPDRTHICHNGNVLNDILWKMAQHGTYIHEAMRDDRRHNVASKVRRIG